MIAPTNCNPYCDCAQRMVRCQKAPPLHRLDPPRVESPPYVIPASLGVQKRTPLSDVDQEELLDALRWLEKEFPATMGITSGEFDDDPGQIRLVTEKKRQRVVKAFQVSDFDLADWSDDILCELADIAIAALEKA